MRKIIAALDLKEDVLLVAEKADDMATKFDAELHLVHIIEPPTGVYLSTGVSDPLGGIEPAILPNEFELSEVQQQNANNDITNIAKKLHSKAITTMILLGDIETEILDYIQKIGADLVVVGTHQHSGLTRLLSRETSVKILREAQVPILVIPTPTRKE